MSKPLIAIVGRPNVGKSMLFNKIIGRRLSIVEDTPGVTRDRIYGESDWNGRKFRLVDTGGIEPNTDNQILAFMREQAQIAIDNANVIIFERIREELRLGLSAKQAVNLGYDRATLTILDANVTTVIAAMVLYQFGTGPIRGFAVTLILGIVASMFTAIFVTRIIFDHYTWTRKIEKLSI